MIMYVYYIRKGLYENLVVYKNLFRDLWKKIEVLYLLLFYVYYYKFQCLDNIIFYRDKFCY